ncbi:MAG: undecaprenyl-diphosphate phosphatase [Bacteroidia bacterium]|jgi:undecaprenyl-diphosphatase|nr:undecaprenyl-diphosphate phosphatase [Bacteroidia bacterium]
METLEAVVLAIIEGITEFLPISSTGHMVIASSMMGIAANDFVKLFTVAIQFGAILSVLALYWRRFLQHIRFYVLLGIAFVPAAVFGKLFNDQIDALLENALVVGIALFVGGFVLLFMDKWFGNGDQEDLDNLSYKQAFSIGLFQVVAMIPGVSRSAATIFGGMQQRLTRKAAAEFSFFLAVPTMFAATVYKLYQFIRDGHQFGANEWLVLGVGNLVAFIVAMLAIKGFVGFVTRYGFKAFGWYRIVVGLLIIGLYLAGVPLQVV